MTTNPDINAVPGDIFVAEDSLDGSKCWLRDGQVIITFNDDPKKGLHLKSEHLHRLLTAMAPFDGVGMRVILPDVLKRHRIRAPFGIAFFSDTKPTIVYLPTVLTKRMARRFFKGFVLVPIVVGIRGTAGNGDILRHVNPDSTRN
ncbi:MAG: hypothetical protein C0518_12940 [Opitutus sp.]|nr:hypothetical protein [Opitutus sp.]